MFVRWRQRQKKSGQTTLYCYLCESKRTEGKVVSKNLGYLGSCPEDFTREQQQAFWEQVEGNLDKHEIAGDKRTKLEGAITRRVPCSDHKKRTTRSENDGDGAAKRMSSSHIAAHVSNSASFPGLSGAEVSTASFSSTSSYPSFSANFRHNDESSSVEVQPTEHSRLAALDTTDQSQPNDLLLQAIFDSWVEGVLILTSSGDCLYTNQYVRQLIEYLAMDRPATLQFHMEIWRVHQASLDSRTVYSSQSVVIESQIRVQPHQIRLRGRLLQLETYPDPLIFISLDGPCQSQLTLAPADIQDYGLTPREQEVWQLWKAHYTYKEIAAKLFISKDTVKKHLRNIRDKSRGEKPIAD